MTASILPERLPRCDDRACGTERAYQRRQQAHAPACQACADGHTDYNVSLKMGHNPARLRQEADRLRRRAARLDAIASLREAGKR